MSVIVIIFVCIFFAFLVFALKELRLLKSALKTGISCLLALLIACFLYGLFNRFSFMHGSSPAGLESGIAYMFFVGVFLGPIVFIVGGLIGALISFLKRRKAQAKIIKRSND